MNSIQNPIDISKWIIGGLLSVILAGFGWVTNWEHTRISDLEHAATAENVRLARIEEKIDVINWKLERMAALAENQLKKP